MAVLITPSIVAEVFCADMHIEETERRWKISRTNTKKIHTYQTEGGIGYGIMRRVERFDNELKYYLERKEREF